MANFNSRSRPLTAFRLALLATSLLATTPAMAQLSTATIRGTVSSGESGVAGATVTATNVETGEVRTAATGADGSYNLTGLRPGTYDISFTPSGGEAIVRRVIVSVGQTASLDADTGANSTSIDDQGATAPGSAAAGSTDIFVTATRLVEVKTSEVATNVSRDQIENLPQNNRNFLNFAALAPGVRVNQTEFRQTFGGGGVGSDRNGDSFGGPQVNVFIDGVSLKSNVNQGGIVGQDVSRGNPFSQLAVQEFRVLTSNFKAEYEDAGTSIITAITKSGTNDLHGELFGTFQNEDMISRDFFQRQRNEDVALKRYQFGAALGGPIARDRIFFFANYEGNIQDRAATVVPGTPPPGATLPFNPADFAGTFVSPFREHLGFAKLSFQISDTQLLEATGSIRQETDLRTFGGQNARSRGESVDNNVYTGKIRHELEGNGFVNEATVDFLLSDLAFGADLNQGFGQIYEGVIAVGGSASFQEVEQQGLTFRDNVSLTNIHWNGNHLVKGGVKISFQKYRVGGSGPNAVPQFNFRFDPGQGLNFSIPEIVRFGGGDPEVEAKTTQIGLFLQDDWEVDRHLTVNLGLRWDYDSNAKNNSFVTPANAAATLRTLGADPRIQPAFFDVEDYISTGDNRDPEMDNFAPRIGFSYDFNGDQRTVLFGGFGRYYDRALFRSAAEETLLTQYRSGQLLFSANGLPRNGQPTIMFQPAYLTPEGFQALLASLAADPTSPGTNELRVIPNDLKTPYADQFSLGIRQRIGALRTSLTFNHTVGKNQIGYAPLNRSAAINAGGFYDYIPLTNGYANIVAAFNSRATRYNAVFVTIDKPYTKASGFGFGIAYTLAFSKERGFAFNFDFPNIGERPFVPNAGDERHRLVANAMVDLPLGLRGSGLFTFGSGVPFFLIDARNGFGARDILFPGNVGDNRMFMQLDLRLQKDISLFDGGRFTLWAEVFNVFNRDNIARYDSFVCCGNQIDSAPNIVVGPPRSLQVGAAFRF
ncbi:MAG TPA: TonB-dependent receptor [Allosphingosinicella sp.]